MQKWKKTEVVFGTFLHFLSIAQPQTDLNMYIVIVLVYLHLLPQFKLAIELIWNWVIAFRWIVCLLVTIVISMPPFYMPPSIRDVIVFTSDCTTEKETIKIFQCLRLISRQAMRNVWFNLQTGCFNFVSFFVVVPLSRWETTRGLLFVPLKCQSSLFATKDQPFTVHTILCLSSEGIRISSRVFNILNSLKCHLLPWMHEWMNEWTRRMSNCIQQFFSLWKIWKHKQPWNCAHFTNLNNFHW